MAKKSGSPKKQAAGKSQVKKSESRKSETSQAKPESARSRTGSRKAKGTSQSGMGKALKSAADAYCQLCLLVILILLAEYRIREN
jgi:hypothetical protein